MNAKPYFMVMVADMARAAEFYKDVFGARLPDRLGEFWTELSVDGATIGLHHGGGTDERDIGLGFQVDDIAAACDAVKRNGGHIATEPQERPGEPIVLAMAVDTEGNRFALSQPKR